MGEPIRRASHKVVRTEAGYAQAEPYAADVLLIADSAADHRQGGERGTAGDAPSEPLDMESVVRKLIALLGEEQPQK